MYLRFTECTPTLRYVALLLAQLLPPQGGARGDCIPYYAHYFAFAEGDGDEGAGGCVFGLGEEVVIEATGGDG